MNHADSITRAPARDGQPRRYVGWGVLALAYAVAFGQRVSPQAVNLLLIRDLGTDTAGVATLASGYFWGYALMQIPAGLLVDRFGVRRVVLASMAASVLGSAAFAASLGIVPAFAARTVLAVGDALVFTCLIKLVAQQFPDGRFGLMSGLSQVSGYVGGALATVPLAAGIDRFGWRTCFLFVAVVGAANLAVATVALPSGKAQPKGMPFGKLLAAVREALSKAANWGCALTFASHFAVVTTLSGVWGIPLVAHALDVEPAKAGYPLMFFMAGSAVGSVALGHLSDRIISLPRALILISVGRMALTASLFPSMIRGFGLTYVAVDFAVLGLVAGGTVPLVLKCTKRLYRTSLIGTGASVNTTTANVAAALAQPLIGIAMAGAAGSSTGAMGGRPALGDTAYAAMLLVLLMISLFGIVGPILMSKALSQETKQ